MSSEELAEPTYVSNDTRVSVVGVGGAGNNLLSHAIGEGLSPANCIAVNNDRGQLSKSLARNKVLLGEANGVSRTAEDHQFTENLQLSVRRVTPFTKASDFTILVAGLGGETATGAALLIAQWSRTQVRPVVSIVAIPFIHERERRFVALRGLKKMTDACDCTLVIDNGMQSGQVSAVDRRADEMASLAMGSLAGLVSSTGHVEQGGLRRVLSLGSIATFCTARIHPGDSIQSIVFEAIKNPSASLPLARTRGAILVFRGPEPMSRVQAAQAYDTIASLTTHNLEFAYGSVTQPGDPRVCLFLTGYDYGIAVRHFVDLIEDLYDLEYGQPDVESLVQVRSLLYQMERN